MSREAESQVQGRLGQPGPAAHSWGPGCASQSGTGWVLASMSAEMGRRGSKKPRGSLRGQDALLHYSPCRLLPGCENAHPSPSANCRIKFLPSVYCSTSLANERQSLGLAADNLVLPPPLQEAGHRKRGVRKVVSVIFVRWAVDWFETFFF